MFWLDWPIREQVRQAWQRIEWGARVHDRFTLQATVIRHNLENWLTRSRCTENANAEKWKVSCHGRLVSLNWVESILVFTLVCITPNLPCSNRYSEVTVPTSTWNFSIRYCTVTFGRRCYSCTSGTPILPTRIEQVWLLLESVKEVGLKLPNSLPNRRHRTWFPLRNKSAGRLCPPISCNHWVCDSLLSNRF